MERQRPWSDLVSDVLREISSHMCSATDFVYFHAVCKPWRNSCDPLSRETTKIQFRPYLLAAPNNVSAGLRFRCIFAKSCYRTMSPRPGGPSRNWVAAAGGTQARYLTVKYLGPTLHDPFTGEFTHLPDFPYDVKRWEEANPRGIIYGDGTIFLYSLATDYETWFRAALLRPGGTEWTVIDRDLVEPMHCPEFCAAYYCGNIMVTVEATHWRVLMRPDGGGDVGDDVLVRLPISTLLEMDFRSRHYSFVLESRGELLWVLIQIGIRRRDFLSFWLHALEEETSPQAKKTRWVKKDGCSLADRVLFLGTPNSFVVDASRLDGQDSGCAYFFLDNSEKLPPQKVGVWRCNLISNKAEFIDRLPRNWNSDNGGRCTWHVPQQPTIAPVQELMKARELKQRGLVINNDVVPSSVSYVTNRNTAGKYMVPARRNEGKKQGTVVHRSNRGVESARGQLQVKLT